MNYLLINDSSSYCRNIKAKGLTFQFCIDSFTEEVLVLIT